LYSPDLHFPLPSSLETAQHVGGSICIVNKSELEDKDEHRGPPQKSQQQMTSQCCTVVCCQRKARQRRDANLKKKKKSIFKNKLTVAEIHSLGNKEVSARR